MNSLFLTVATAGAEAPTSALTETMKSTLQSGFSTMQATVTDVIGIAIVASVAVICLTAGVNYALKKIRGVMSKAS